MAANQGSRLALVTWTAITSILAVAATILAIYFYVDSSKVADRAENEKKALNEVIDTTVLRSQTEEIDKLKAARSDTNRGMDPSMKLFNVALAERNNLVKLVGAGTDDATAAAAAKTTTDKVKAAKINLTGDSLIATAEALLAEVEARRTEAVNATKDSQESKQKLTEVSESIGAQIAKMNEDNAKVRAERDAALDTIAKANTAQVNAFDTAATELRKQLEVANATIADLNMQNAAHGKKIVELDLIVRKLQEKLGLNRVDPNRATIRQVDGRILRLPAGAKQQCIIDLGHSDQVTPGLTFAVYDKNEGVPAVGDPANENNLPVGKASIEVTNVLPTGSVCRIIRITPGATLSEGDLLVNLVYDRNVKYNFLVYGNFDLDQNGTATPQDTEVIKRKITEWGGKIASEINVDTDFVVLGKEPVVPDKPRDPDPIAQANWEQAMAASEAYANILAKARDYWIPVLNQNRFLYFVGFYEEAQR